MLLKNACQLGGARNAMRPRPLSHTGTTRPASVIAVNPAQHSNRQRFTIAHELGHYFLHKDLGEHVDQNFRVAWRKADSSAGVNWIEIEANRFAAELLIPTRFLKSDLDSLDSIDIRTVAVLASRYGVSKDAMKFRLTNLGILGIPNE